MSEPIIGIDLGTTNSEVAIIENGIPLVISDADNQQMLPSFVGLNLDGELLVGEAARNQYHVYPERTVKSIKRKMGSTDKVEMVGQQYSPQEISAMILRQLKINAERYLGLTVSQAVITVPAYFNEAQRQATREAGQIAGLDVVRLLNEPTAAALSYDVDFKGQKRALVLDLGGGTLDVSIVNIQDGVVEVLASHGDTQLGGDDFDEQILKLVYQHINQKIAVDVEQMEEGVAIRARLWRAAIEAKQLLSSRPYVKIEEEFLLSHNGVPYNLSMELSRDQYEQAIMPYMQQILDTAQIALKSTDLTIADMDEILLAGGATRTPLVSQMLAAEAGLEPKGGLHPDLSVVQGAAIQAAMIAGESVSSVLVDITPYSFGTRIIGELDGMPYPALFYPVIKRNTPIPVTRSELFFTAQDRQQYVDLKIYQGEDDNALNNILIGEFRVEGLRKVRYKNPVIVEFSLDLNGLLTVKATEKETGLNKTITIQNACPRLDSKEIERAQQKLNSLAGNDQTSTDVAKLSKWQKRIEKIKQSTTESDIKTINNLLEAIEIAKDKQDNKQLARATEQLENILYYLES
ncbi:MAG: Hsp70 family protein [Methylococcales bacterium]